MAVGAINFARKLDLGPGPGLPRVVAAGMNDGATRNIVFKLVKLQGESRHAHADTDEPLVALAGTLRMDLRELVAGAGGTIVVPRGAEHSRRADGECHVSLVEPRGVVNAGDAGGAPRAPDDVWV